MLKKENKKDLMRGCILHAIPGRMRIQYEGLRYLYDYRQEIAKELSAIKGIVRVQVTPCTCSVLLCYDEAVVGAASVNEQADTVMARYTMDVLRASHSTESEEEAEQPMTTGTIIKRLAVNAGAMVLGNTLFTQPLLGGVFARFTTLEAASSLGLTVPMMKGAMKGIKKDLRPNADFLTVTSIVASLLLDAPHSALMIIALSDIAELMTAYTIERTRASIKKMLSVGDDEIWKVLSDGRVVKTPVTQAQAGDVIEVHAGEKIAVDGTIISGTALIDQSAVTGEFVPAEKQAGDEVFAGTLVKSGTIQIDASRVGDATVVSRIVGMVESSELKKAPIQRYADRFSNYLVPLNFLLCISVWIATKNPQKALKMLVIDYSCGIKLSTATAFSAAINTALKRGVLIKGGAYIEQMADANTVLLDKTGTVTEGKPEIVSMVNLSTERTDEEVLSLAMAAEETSTHPLASAILSYGRALGVTIPPHEEVITEVSMGSRAQVDGRTVRVGKLKYMQENGVKIKNNIPESHGEIESFVSVDDELVAVLYALDSPRENMRRAVNALRYDGVGDIEILTGDIESQAQLLAEQIGADGCRAQLMPEEKAEAVLKLQAQGNGVIMVGDGINDAPALAYADVGISMGSTSTDIAIETSDVVINRDEPMMIPRLRKLSKDTMRIVNQNFAVVVGVNTVGLILGASSGISVMMSALLHNASTILVVANSLRLMLFSPKES